MEFAHNACTTAYAACQQAPKAAGAALQAVRHIEAMTASPEGSAQYERLVGAVKGSQSRNSVYRMPALQSYQTSKALLAAP